MVYFNADFYLSLLALATGIGGGIYFLSEWVRHGRKYRFLLFWAVALFCLFLFQIPSIFFNGHAGGIVTNFNLFFSVTLPISFLGLVAEYLGILSLARPIGTKTYLLFFAWLLAGALYFASYFAPGRTFTSHLPLYGAIVLFFLPIHFLNLWALYVLHRGTRQIRSAVYSLGLGALLISFLSGLGRNIVFLRGFAIYPASFWFLALQSEWLFLLQLSGTLFLLVGFVLIHRNYFRDHQVLMNATP
jgi:hypothetical protein